MTLVHTSLPAPHHIAEIVAGVPLRRRDGSTRAWAWVDLEDWPAVNVRRWSWDGRYPRAKIGDETVRLHRFLLGPPPAGMVTDHRNRWRLDHRRRNLRFVTHRESVRSNGGRGCRACEREWACRPEALERARRRQRERYRTDPEYRERKLARERERYRTDPEFRARVIAQDRAYQARPEVRARKRERDRGRKR